MTLYVRKSEAIDAMQFVGEAENVDKINLWLKPYKQYIIWHFNNDIIIPVDLVNIGLKFSGTVSDWVVRSARGDLLILDNDYFQSNYIKSE